jgi:endo-alpha-1,4-polygalactosaminidase (GH114 family)
MGPIGEIMDILHTTRKGKYMDTVEKFYIYKETQKNNQINDKNTVKLNAIFEAMLGHYTNGENIE